jgi:biopolymer transport protein ExbB
MRLPESLPGRRSSLLQTIVAFVVLLSLMAASTAMAQQAEAAAPDEKTTQSFLNVRDMLAAGGAIGYVIMFLSFIMVALVIDYFLNIRRASFMPPGLAEEVHRCLAEKKIPDALKTCEKHPGFLSRVLTAGLEEVATGSFAVVEKAMEDSAAEQSNRYFRRIEHLSVISTLAPMLGLMGTVWGMILAFMEFEMKANPQISELAPGVYKALVTTLQGLGVAIPAIGALAFFRSRVEELSTETTLLAAHVFANFRRAAQRRRSGKEDS